MQATLELFRGIDWSLIVAVLSLLVSVIAIYIGVVEVRRNNSPSGHPIEASCSFSQLISENQGKLFAHFEIAFKNTGVRLVAPQLRLEFKDVDRGGSVSWSLSERKELRGSNAELERNMIAAFELKSYRNELFASKMLSALKDVRAQGATLRVYSQSYLAYEFKIGSRRDRFKGRWNAFVQRLRMRLSRTIKPKNGTVRTHVPEWLPLFVSLEWQIMQYVDYLRKHVPPDEPLGVPAMQQPGGAVPGSIHVDST